MTDPRVEAAARAMFDRSKAEVLAAKGFTSSYDYAEISEKDKEYWRDMIRPIIAAADAAAWRPIETAPRDKEIILFYPKVLGSDAGIYKGRWDCDQYRKIPKPYWGGGYADLWGIIHAKKNPPTHWQPLPNPPGEEAGA
ncbi:DUF551 domain-containing protein [Acetobacter malorum]|uniref:DUF551 domain-containing protein n=1 Tax=Acetobacter malorum TaxID=178901 RepID=UPI00248DC38D|nr:DUF551 domain-containing protein [Acetobacter malorum]